MRKKHIVEQAKKAMHLLFIKANNLDLPLDLQIKLFDNTILPILTYGCEIFGYENTDILECVHLEFLRKISKLRKSTPRYMLYAEFGRFPLKIIIKQRMLNFWTRLLTGKSTKLSHQLYLYMYHSNQIESKWINYIRAILNEAGRGDLWVRQFVSIPLCTGKIVKCILKDQFFQSWNDSLQNSSKGRNYSLFKDNINCENYIKTLNSINVINMLKFRTGNHKFPVEVGRWNNVDISERKCHLCQTSSIGDEFHYLLECSYFQRERRIYIDQYFYRRPNILKYKQLLAVENESKLTLLSKFMKIIMKCFS